VRLGFLDPAWEALAYHPRHALDGEELAVLDLYLAWRGGGFGPGHLPFAGGAAEQPAGLMAALSHCAAVEATIRERGKERGR
jgi:hypothetical protein